MILKFFETNLYLTNKRFYFIKINLKFEQFMLMLSCAFGKVYFNVLNGDE